MKKWQRVIIFFLVLPILIWGFTAFASILDTCPEGFSQVGAECVKHSEKLVDSRLEIITKNFQIKRLWSGHTAHTTKERGLRPMAM